MKQLETVILSKEIILNDGTEIKISLDIEKITPFNNIDILNRVTCLTNDIIYQKLPQLLSDKPTQ
ncbi:hypothetical protein U728_730 [Clostridium botulinum 202F]|uniref:hypothetical protein n=1 Tax=Clostridium TaxID=1485 RepID=UPI000540FA7D|nr:hypothetical protein [Clostridium botulinum]AIY81572.1 hypothetical protein U728_730 [Clostridium botulinum 202F]KON14740.1 hypothetical protein ACP50_00895 [Clostridium botulinum]MBY6987078.1 hypothetical protein [Clostridium botulinum]NFF21797.1 hypothetical protein [Clostridium botulinum]NFF37592.1 hypothetical protein [Clostridium botulinum]